MAAQKVNAREIRMQIEDSLNPGTWTEFRTANFGSGEGGINSVTITPEYETTDTTTFGSQGRAESQVMQEGRTFVMEGFLLKDPSSGALDPAMALVELQAARLGGDSLTGFRFAFPGDTTWEVWADAHFQLGDKGGGNNDKVTWSCTVTRSGPATTAAIA
ncbi:phage tail tube protein [Streptomyces sp. NPDC013457]|uniref:phage tail tube protein n=1 Tax=Streptomyces sp. NPDC013457 TaxID=3364866 RepID=UPI0036FE84F4